MIGQPEGSRIRSSQGREFVAALRARGTFVQIETNEVLLRGWHISGQAVRPEHTMVGHTGFVTVARLIAAT